VADLLRQMPGLVRLRVDKVSEALRERIGQLSDIVWSEPDHQTLELQGRDVKTILLRVVAVLNELNVELINLETQEPNLERVFLHLTGRGLRD
jgi:ABC-2 type transport system ATP-binding protein